MKSFKKYSGGYEGKVVRFRCDTLPPMKCHEWNTTSAQLAEYLRRLLETHQTLPFVLYLELPSVMDLAGHFRCSETDIFEALSELHQQSYLYEITGIDNPIRLSDPQLRKPGSPRRWDILSGSELKPFSDIYRDLPELPFPPRRDLPC